MQKSATGRISQVLFLFALILIIYMPLHVFIAQSASLLTGGLDVWKAGKDVVLFVAGPVLLYLSYKRGLFQDKTFRILFALALSYGLLHGLFLIFDQNDDTYSALVGSVYNTRLLLYLLLGYLVGTAKNAQKYLKYLLTAVVLIASALAVFGIAQYFLPSDLLTNVGYSIERGVKPLFFIDDRPDLPRVMSTLKDPNSFGAYLIMPILLSGYALLKRNANKEFFVRPFQHNVLVVMLALQLTALFLTFSRGALVGLIFSIVVLLFLTERKIFRYVTKYFRSIVIVGIVLVMLMGVVGYFMRDSAFVQDYVLHSATTTNLADPNELRVSLARGALEDVIETPQGHGPGSAGLVSINNPRGGVLTENYYLQIGYEVGWLGLAMFLAIFFVLIRKLRQSCNLKSESKYLARVILASLAGYLFYSLLIHLWSNEAVALQWWLLTGVVLSVTKKLANK